MEFGAAKRQNFQGSHAMSDAPLAEPDSLLDLRGAADYLGCSTRMVQNLWRNRELPAVKLGRLVRFRRSDHRAVRRRSRRRSGQVTRHDPDTRERRDDYAPKRGEAPSFHWTPRPELAT